MAELLEPTTRRRQDVSRRDSRNRMRALTGVPRPQRRINEAPTRSAGISALSAPHLARRKRGACCRDCRRRGA